MLLTDSRIQNIRQTLSTWSRGSGKTRRSIELVFNAVIAEPSKRSSVLIDVHHPILNLDPDNNHIDIKRNWLCRFAAYCSDHGYAIECNMYMVRVFPKSKPLKAKWSL